MKEDEDALASIPPELREAIEKRWGQLTPTKAMVEALIAAAKGGMEIVGTENPEIREAMRRAVFSAMDLMVDDASKRGEEEIVRHEAAMERADRSREVRAAGNADRDAAIREEAKRHPFADTKAERAMAVVRALKKRAKSEGWTLPGVKQLLRILEGA